MMQKIKYALAFLAGTVYTINWWAFLTAETNSPMLLISGYGIAFGGAGIFAVVVLALIKHWKD